MTWNGIIGPGSGTTCPRCHENTYYGHREGCDFSEWWQKQQDTAARKLGERVRKALAEQDDLELGRAVLDALDAKGGG